MGSLVRRVVGVVVAGAAAGVDDLRVRPGPVVAGVGATGSGPEGPLSGGMVAPFL